MKRAFLLLSLVAGVLATSPPAPGSERAESPPSPGTRAPGPSTSAASADQRLRQVRARKEVLARELQRLRSEERSLLGDVERLELEVRLRAEELREIQLGLQRNQAQMDETLKQVDALQAELVRARPKLAAHARSLYKLGELSYLRLLLSVDRPSDFFRGYRYVSALARHDREEVARFRADLVALEAQRLVLEQRTAEALSLRSQLEAARVRLEADRRRKTELLTSLVEKKELHAAYLQELTEAENRLQEMLDGLAEGEVPVPLGAFRGALPWPAPGRVRVPFGKRKGPKFDTYTRENGVEIDVPPATPVHAVHEGIVVFADRFRGYGLLVVLDHGAKHHSLYAHLGEIRVETGQRLAAGETLGTAGDGDGLEGRGLYFEMRFQGRPEDPLDWLRSPGDQ